MVRLVFFNELLTVLLLFLNIKHTRKVAITTPPMRRVASSVASRGLARSSPLIASQCTSRRYQQDSNITQPPADSKVFVDTAATISSAVQPEPFITTSSVPHEPQASVVPADRQSMHQPQVPAG
ncbi:Hypothetical protein, putative [Bodo saltans]|uniref:Membrane-associated protein n=1 Tax=Bodo saltans TaxID=75058 RepID=A0A0S4JUL2_BODSA|nr:Hypothetical protein, putative [Bodo saltans]|eukprot:CUG94260.1 Hypothetical protein, putative [Bodo saltans]